MELLIVFLVLSLMGNCIFAFYLFKKKQVVTTVDAQKLLSDILSGPTIIRIEVVDTANLIYRSPKR